jgi:hypothetical protein
VIVGVTAGRRTGVWTVLIESRATVALSALLVTGIGAGGGNGCGCTRWVLTGDAGGGGGLWLADGWLRVAGGPVGLVPNARGTVAESSVTISSESPSATATSAGTCAVSNTKVGRSDASARETIHQLKPRTIIMLAPAIPWSVLLLARSNAAERSSATYWSR